MKAVSNMCTAFESKTNFLMGTKGVSYHNVSNRITTYLTYRIYCIVWITTWRIVTYHMYCIVCFALKHNMMDRNVSYRIFSVSEQIESYWSILHHIVSYSNTILVSLPTHQKHWHFVTAADQQSRHISVWWDRKSFSTTPVETSEVLYRRHKVIEEIINETQGISKSLTERDWKIKMSYVWIIQDSRVREI